MRPWANCNRVLYMDNLYTSPNLCDDLLRMDIRSCGICRPNRSGLPPRIREAMKQLDKGEFKSWQRGQLGCLAWHSARPILVLSTHHRVDHFVTVTHTDDRASEVKPQVAVDYNHNEGHVDGVDQMRQYVLERRVQRTWPSLARWLLDMAIVNSYALWSLDTHTCTGQLHFREQLVHQIAAQLPSSHTHVQLYVPPDGRTAQHGHWPRHIDERGTCVNCTHGRAGRRTSRFVCELCGVHLCVDGCFKKYHVGKRQRS